ncbi:MAG: DUF4328 domain-containing protein [Actinobacteria bacterium]|nr:MAG: DUF4328 domain-containing protein [Actinomycetota bacterium]
MSRLTRSSARTAGAIRPSIRRSPRFPPRRLPRPAREWAKARSASVTRATTTSWASARASSGSGIERAPEARCSRSHYLAWEPRAVEVPHASAAAPDLAANLRSYRSGHTLARWVTWLLLADCLVDVVGLFLLIARIDALRQVELGERSLASVADDSNRLRAVGVVGGLVTLAILIVWLVWQHRSHANLRALGAGNLRFTPGWVVGWWFIPFADFVFPYLTMRELVKASEPTTGVADWAAQRTPALVGLWWAAFLGRTVIGSIGRTVSRNATSVGALLHGQTFELVAIVVEIAAAVLAILIVHDVDRRQSAKFARVTEYTSTLVGTPVSSFGA